MFYRDYIFYQNLSNYSFIFLIIKKILPKNVKNVKNILLLLIKFQKHLKRIAILLSYEFEFL